ncbi:hypothetical protein BC830DRAFT_1114691 [Chytriomyces sp. MP71]|nr:hypothetical protein BC830DRAFT_1114691 [Chytriomyces sp. MP71]
MLSVDLIPRALLASSTYGSNVNAIKATSPNDEENRSTLWVSDSHCIKQWITADWSSQGSFSLSSFTIWHGNDSAGPPVIIQLLSKGGNWLDVLHLFRCTFGTTLEAQEYNVCRFDENAPPGSFDNIVLATFAFDPPMIRNVSSRANCGMSLHELRMYGVPSPELSPNTVATICSVVLGCIVALLGCGILLHCHFKRRKDEKRVLAQWEDVGQVSEGLVALQPITNASAFVSEE